MRLDERCAFGRALRAVLIAALPFEHRPGIVAGRGQPRKHLLEVHLAVAERTEPARPLLPAEIAAINARFRRGPVFGVLHVKCLDPLRVHINKADVVQALKDEVRGIVIDRHARMVPRSFEELLERSTVIEVLARVQFVGDVDAVLVGEVENRLPPHCQFREALLDQARRPLRPRINERPHQRAAERRCHRQPHIRRGLNHVLHLLDGPLGPRRRVALYLRRGERVEHLVVGRMDRHKLSLQMRRQFGDREAGSFARDLVAIVLRFGRFLHVHDAAVPGWQLNPDVAEALGPRADVRQVVERGFVAHELRQKDGWSFDQ